MFEGVLTAGAEFLELCHLMKLLCGFNNVNLKVNPWIPKELELK